MPRRDDLERIVILGSGPIRIGQAAEFDFSAIFLKRRAGLIKDATRDDTSAASSVSPPRAVL